MIPIAQPIIDLIHARLWWKECACIAILIPLSAIRRRCRCRLCIVHGCLLQRAWRRRILWVGVYVCRLQLFGNLIAYIPLNEFFLQCAGVVRHGGVRLLLHRRCVVRGHVRRHVRGGGWCRGWNMSTSVNFFQPRRHHVITTSCGQQGSFCVARIYRRGWRRHLSDTAIFWRHVETLLGHAWTVIGAKPIFIKQLFNAVIS